MGFALSALSSLCEPLRRIATSMRARPTHHGLPGLMRTAYLADTQASNDPRCAAIAGPASRRAATPGPAEPARPLAGAPARPLRVVVSRQDGKPCRLVISGRMADVCAELNRLALH
ncbi:hypothetical protein [Oryzisolibacter sp. LB2S]|uniref:hypothetical protein n=1 Tax=Alicycliphilus soli TaxID=3228789 RepID=UPI00345748E2